MLAIIYYYTVITKTISQLEITKIQLRKIATEDGYVEKADFIKVN